MIFQILQNSEGYNIKEKKNPTQLNSIQHSGNSCFSVKYIVCILRTSVLIWPSLLFIRSYKLVSGKYSEMLLKVRYKVMEMCHQLFTSLTISVDQFTIVVDTAHSLRY